MAAELQPFIDAGATWISIIDLLPSVLDPSEGEKAMGRSLELAGLLKAANRGVPAAAAGGETTA